MIYQGKAITINVADGIAHLVFDQKDDSVNKLDMATVQELREAVDVLHNASDVKGLVISSNKAVFIVGADISEFKDMFAQNTEEYLAESIYKANLEVFNRYEDLPFPTVSVINGLALGGGLEMCLTSDFRIMANDTKIRLPGGQLRYHSRLWRYGKNATFNRR